MNGSLSLWLGEDRLCRTMNGLTTQFRWGEGKDEGKTVLDMKGREV